MKVFRWNKEKNRLLDRERGVTFEEVFIAINEGGLLDLRNHPNQEKYPGQKMFVVMLNQYVYLVPFIESDTDIFLKTIIPSRKATKKYLIDK